MEEQGGSNVVFVNNLCEYILRVLYESTNKLGAIDTALSMIGGSYGVSRVYVYEHEKESGQMKNTFGWRCKDIQPNIEVLPTILEDAAKSYAENFDDHGVFFLPDINVATGALRERLELRGVVSMVQLSIEKSGEFMGFVGFDECENQRIYAPHELETFKNIANILGVFITEMRENAIGSAERALAQSIVDAIPAYIYIIDSSTHELLLTNRALAEAVKGVRPGAICHRIMKNSKFPCEDCPMKAMPQGDGHTTRVLVPQTMGIALRVTAAWVDWTQGKKACLISAVRLEDESQPKR